MKHKAPTQRQLKVSEELRHSLSGIFRQGSFYEPALSGISITVSEIRISPDLKNATVYVSPLGGQAPEGFLETLNEIAPQLRYELTRQVNLRFSPKLFFKMDNSFAVASNIDAILDQI